jgi:UDP-N-acetylmuramate: L-alanyl-gamma-D-glutamyl-meso-diaminopimelate ligase
MVSPLQAAQESRRAHYHLIGIAGTAMASLAGLLKEAGHMVTGSDENVYPPMSDRLRAVGVEYAQGYRAENLRPRPDVVVVGNAIMRGNPELEATLRDRLYYTSAPVVIKELFLFGRHPIAVAGTHGKTTTASLLAWVLDAAGLNPSFLIGGVAENFGSSYRLTESEYFVIEADEYDTAYFDKGPKMWHYLPRTAVVNNIDFDHADIYRDETAYRFAFARFINLVPDNGALVAGWDSPIVRELASRSLAPVESFGYDPDAEASASAPHWSARDVEFGTSHTRFRVEHGGEHWGTVESPLAGAFNVRNTLAAIAAAHAIGAPPAGVVEGIRTFRSVKRRMEERGTARGVTVVDDFAHHPTAVRETIAAARQKYHGRPVIAVFEPRSFTAQRKEMQAPYLEALSHADEVILAGLFHPDRYAEGTALDPAELAAELKVRGRRAAYIPDVEAIVRDLVPRLTSREVILVMSNGGFGGIHEKLLAAIATAESELRT